VDITGKQGENVLLTPSFGNRNYEISAHSIEPRFSYIRGTGFRLQFSYKYDQRENKTPLNILGFGGESSTINSLIAETKYNVLNNASLQGKFTYGYILLDALVPGKNYLWSIDFIKRLSNNLEINLRYEGRKAGETRTVHIGTARVTALF
jgi:hypothetical protein